MKNFACVFILVLSYCTSFAKGEKDSLFTQADARKIMGQACHMAESATTPQSKSTMYRSTYTADTREAASGKLGNIYYILEWYTNDSAAHQEYYHIKSRNESYGIRELKTIGDEAYFQTDRENFYFILVRKGKKMFRIKVNPMTSHTSEEMLMETARNITSKL